ncbi:MAG: pyruvate kinase [Rickettsiales bacterium]|jgi:pyruvate kinase|nr:pyruvate kinase [Rickettsiales bacterium]
MQKLTKITSTIGPASEPIEILRDMLNSGLNVCRLNFSHDSQEAQAAKIKTIRKLSVELDRPIAIMADTQGPKHRIGDFAGTYPADGSTVKTVLKVGQEFVFDTDPALGDNTRVQLPDGDVLGSLKVGDTILLNDGKMAMKVLRTEPGKVVATVLRGTEIWDRRGFNLPDTEVATSVLTEKDRSDLDFVLPLNPDFVAISFVQKPEDIVETRDYITARTNAPIKIVSKIERPQALERIEEIIKVSDVIMFARGDLAVEVPFEQLPALQRKLIRLCRQYNRPIIVATQMLGSMMHSEFPLRAEISDVANAAYLRADSTMTSEETSIGEHPLKVVETMSKILTYADEDGIENHYDWSRVENIPENDWSRSVTSMAYLNKAAAIVVFARDTVATTEISCRRPDVPIIAVCNEPIIANQLCMSRGVFPICDEQLFGQRDGFNSARKFGINRGKLVIVDEEKISLREID